MTGASVAEASGVTAGGRWETGRGGSGTATAAARGARNTAPCGARKTALDAVGGVPSAGRDVRLAWPPLRLDAAGTERGVLFGPPLFGVVLGGRGARDEPCGVGSTDNIAAIRSAWVMPDMSTAGGATLGGGFEPAALTDRGAEDGCAAAAAGAALFAAVDVDLPPFVPVGAGAGIVAAAVAGASLMDPTWLADGAGEGAFVDRGVASGARRMT